MSNSELPPGTSGPVNPERQPNYQAPEQAPAPSLSGSLYEQPTVIGSQVPPSPSGPMPQAPFSQPWLQPSGPLPQMPGSQPWQTPSGPLPQMPGSQPFQPYGSAPTMPNSQPFQPPSGPLAPMSGPIPMTLPSGPLTQPAATPGAGASSPGWKGWALSFALFGVVLAVAGGIVFFVTPGPSPAFAKEQHPWAVNPVIGWPVLIAGLLLLVVPFILPAALKPSAKQPMQTGASATPALVGAPLGSASAMPASQPWPPASGPMPASQPWPPMSGPMPPLPDSQPFQPPSGPLPQPPGSQPWPPSGPTGPS